MTKDGDRRAGDVASDSEGPFSFGSRLRRIRPSAFRTDGDAAAGPYARSGRLSARAATFFAKAFPSAGTRGRKSARAVAEMHKILGMAVARLRA